MPINYLTKDCIRKASERVDDVMACFQSYRPTDVGPEQTLLHERIQGGKRGDVCVCVCVCLGEGGSS